MCVCVSHTDLLGLLQPSIHSCGKCRQTIDPLKLAVRATCLPLTKTETPDQAGQRCREQEGRRGGGWWGEYRGAGTDHTLLV